MRSAAGLGAATKSNKQVLGPTLTKAKPDEEDLLTARYRSMIWAHPSKGWRREGLSGGLGGLGDAKPQQHVKHKFRECALRKMAVQIGWPGMNSMDERSAK